MNKSCGGINVKLLKTASLILALCMLALSFPLSSSAVEECEVHNSVLETKEPTCTENGYVKYFCPTCGYVHSYYEIPATGHTPGNWKSILEPSDGSEGAKERYCITCGEFLDVEPYTESAPAIKVEMSDPVSYDADHNSITATVSVRNNPGLWSIVLYFPYDEAFSAESVTPGNVFSAEVATVMATPDIDVANNPTASEAFRFSGDEATGRRAVCYYAEASDLADIEGDGVVMSVKLVYDKALEGTYLFGLSADPDSVINFDEENVSFVYEEQNTALASSTPIRQGDVNCDGVVNAHDLSALKGALVNLFLPGVTFDSCDVNCDGVVNAHDVAELKEIFVS